MVHDENEDEGKLVCVDVDDVTLEFNSSFVEWHNREFGTTVDRVTDYGFWTHFGITREVMEERVRQFARSSAHAEAPACEGAIEAMHQLRERYDLHLVTARAEVLRQPTEAWLARHFSGWQLPVHYTNGFAAPAGAVRETKGVVCRRLGAVALIDDALSNAFEVAQAGIPVHLLRRDWNRGVEPLPALVTPHESWASVVTALLER